MMGEGDVLQMMEDDDDTDSDSEMNAFLKERSKNDTLEERKKVLRFIQASRRAEEEGVDEGDLLGYKPDLRMDWDDKEGYYRARIGEMIEDRYEVVSDACGRGMFSNVVKCKDHRRNLTVAIKVIRTNDMMRDAAEKEVDILRKLCARQEKDDRRNIVRLFRHFDFRNHLCLVFEFYHANLRQVLKQYGRGKGLHIRAVSGYAKQMMLGLKLMRACQIIHADIKLDNVLISEDKQKLKICDLGCAHEVSEAEAGAEVCSRFYRAVELCLRLKYDTQVDVWSTAVSIYEMYTGEILFTGSSDNDMIRRFQNHLGKMVKKMVNLANNPTVAPGQPQPQRHFNKEGEFVWRTFDGSTKKSTSKVLIDFPTERLEDMILAKTRRDVSEQHRRKARQLGDFLVKCLMFDPAKRATPEGALDLPFLTEKWNEEKEDAAKAPPPKPGHDAERNGHQSKQPSTKDAPRRDPVKPAAARPGPLEAPKVAAGKQPAKEPVKKDAPKEPQSPRKETAASSPTSEAPAPAAEPLQ
jgi:serine/threonine-protein kinase PRP4